MKNVVLMKKTAPRPVAISYGQVTGRKDDFWFVLTDDGRVLGAQKADGCLLTPEISDRVLLTEDGGDEGFILNVLVKSGGRSEMVLPGQGTIRAGDGDLALTADTITVSAQERASFAAPEVSFTGVTARTSFLSFSFFAQTLEARVGKAATMIETLDTVCGRLTERLKTSFRWIENFEQTKAGRISTIVKERFAVRARHASILTEEEVTIDGKKIHLG
ncbi:MAG: DUF3540 domain-containing protein [Syntrophales bacterium]